MPEVKDMITGEVISKQPYTEEGAKDSVAIADSNPSWEVDYNYPSSDASERNVNTDFDTYMGGGQIHDVANKLDMYKEGGKVKKTKAEMDREYWAEIEEQRKREHKEATKDKITIYDRGHDVTSRDDARLHAPQLREAEKELEAAKKGELKNKPNKRKYTEEVKAKPKYGKKAAESVAKKKKKKPNVKSKEKHYSIKKEGVTYKKKGPDSPVKKKSKPKFVGLEYETEKKKK